MPTPTSLLVAHPQELIRAGLRAMLAGSPVEILAEATDAASTLTLAKKHTPAVMLVDAAIPGADAFELVGKLSKLLPTTSVVMLSALENPSSMARARAVGAANFLLMGFAQKEIVAAIESAAARKAAAEPGPLATIAASLQPRDVRVADDSGLTPRESQVLAGIALGLSNQEIAEALQLSIETVKVHVRHVLGKLAVNDRTQAAVWAVRSGMV